MAKAKKKEALSLEEKLEQALVPIDEQPYELPKNWCWVKLGEVVRLNRGSSPRPIKSFLTESNDGVNWIKIGDTDAGKYINETKEKITKEGAKKSVPVKAGDLLLTNSMSYGKPFILNIDGCIHDGWFAIETGECFDKDFLYYSFLASQWYFDKIAVGTAVRNISSDRTFTTPLAMPPLAEQKRIVEQIESLFTKLDEAKEKSLIVLESFDINCSAILYAAFSGELSKKWRKENHISKDTWKEMVVGDIGEVVTGSTPSTKNPEYFDGDIPFIKPTELNQGKYVCTSADYLTEAGRDVSRPVRKGSTCVCCIGATISKCGMLQVDAVTNQQINTIVPYDFMYDEYVYYYCSSDRFKNVLVENASATTLPIINKSRMSQLPVSVPLIEEQKFIVNELDILLKKQEEAKALAEEVVVKIDLIKRAILAKAFRGELGTNNPDEESATELLKTILMQE